MTKKYHMTCKVCGESHTFTKLREFWMCSGEHVGFDSGDGFYTRILGKPENYNLVKHDGKSTS